MPLFVPAVKEQLKARVAIDGPTGAGKTWTALQLARILAGPDGLIGLVDTENRSAAYYASAPGATVDRVNWWDPPYEFGHLPKSAPYDPRELRTLIQAAGKELGPDGVLVIDSLTHFWNGEGGTLDVVDNASSRGNSFTGWKEGSPAQRGMLDAIIHADCHVIVTMRSKMEYILEQQEKNGKTIQVPTKVGMAPEQRAGVEYEFTVVADMDLEHRLVVSKSRCDLIADKVAPKGRSAEVWQAFTEWLAIGVERISGDSASAIVTRFRSVADEGRRRQLWDEFVGKFGKPSEVTVDRMDDVGGWLAQNLGDTTQPTLTDATDDYGTDREPPADDPTPEPQRLTGTLADALDDIDGESGDES